MHVVLRVAGELGRLRRRKAYAAIRAAMIATLGRAGFRVVHVSIQHHHIHLLCEADDRAALSNGVRALCISAARRLNLLVTEERGVRRRGRVFADLRAQRARAHERASPARPARRVSSVASRSS